MRNVCFVVPYFILRKGISQSPKICKKSWLSSYLTNSLTQSVLTFYIYFLDKSYWARVLLENQHSVLINNYKLECFIFSLNSQSSMLFKFYPESLPIFHCFHALYLDNLQRKLLDGRIIWNRPQWDTSLLMRKLYLSHICDQHPRSLVRAFTVRSHNKGS